MVRRTEEPYAGFWDIPGGHCELGEHPAATAVREVAEEACLDIRLTGVLGVWLSSNTNPAGTPILPSVCAYYFAAPFGISSGPKPGSETSETAYFSPDYLPSKIAFAEHQDAVLRAWRRCLGERNLTTPLLDLEELGLVSS